MKSHIDVFCRIKPCKRYIFSETRSEDLVNMDKCHIKLIMKIIGYTFKFQRIQDRVM